VIGKKQKQKRIKYSVSGTKKMSESLGYLSNGLNIIELKPRILKMCDYDRVSFVTVTLIFIVINVRQ